MSSPHLEHRSRRRPGSLASEEALGARGWPSRWQTSLEPFSRSLVYPVESGGPARAGIPSPYARVHKFQVAAYYNGTATPRSRKVGTVLQISLVTVVSPHSSQKVFGMHQVSVSELQETFLFHSTSRPRLSQSPRKKGVLHGG